MKGQCFFAWIDVSSTFGKHSRIFDVLLTSRTRRPNSFPSCRYRSLSMVNILAENPYFCPPPTPRIILFLPYIFPQKKIFRREAPDFRLFGGIFWFKPPFLGTFHVFTHKKALILSIMPIICIQLQFFYTVFWLISAP